MHCNFLKNKIILILIKYLIIKYKKKWVDRLNVNLIRNFEKPFHLTTTQF